MFDSYVIENVVLTTRLHFSFCSQFNSFNWTLACERTPGEPCPTPIASLILLFRARRIFFSILGGSLFAG